MITFFIPPETYSNKCLFLVLFLLNIQMCSSFQTYYWIPDFSPFFYYSDQSNSLCCFHLITSFIFFFTVDIVSIAKYFFIINTHYEELNLYISRMWTSHGWSHVLPDALGVRLNIGGYACNLGTQLCAFPMPDMAGSHITGSPLYICLYLCCF